RLASALGLRAGTGADGRGFAGLPARVWGRAIAALLGVAVALGILSPVPEGNPVWQFVHARGIAEASFIQQEGTAGWDNDGGASCIPKSDGYHAVHNAYCSAPPYGVDNLSTYTIAVSARETGPTATNFYGLGFRSSTASRYEFLISSDGYIAVRLFTLRQPSRNLVGPPYRVSLINTGVDVLNRLEVRMSGSHFAFVVNGTVIGQIDDATLSSGSLGFVSFNVNRVFDPNHVATPAEYQTGDVVFTDFKITAPLFGG